METSHDEGAESSNVVHTGARDGTDIALPSFTGRAPLKRVNAGFKYRPCAFYIIKKIISALYVGPGGRLWGIVYALRIYFL